MGVTLNSKTRRDTCFPAYFDSVKIGELDFFQQKKVDDRKDVLSKSFGIQGLKIENSIQH